MPAKPVRALDVLHRAIQSTAMRVEETRSNQDSDAPDTDRLQEQGFDADGVYQFAYRLYALPPEIRDMVFAFACNGNPISLPGVAPNGIISLILALQNPQLRSKLLKGIWQTFPIQWEGGLQWKAWKRFKKTVIPHIRRLTIKFEVNRNNCIDGDSEIRRTLAWMWKRGQRGNRARYFWCLEQLHLIGIIYLRHQPHWHWHRQNFPYPQHHHEHWRNHFLLKRLEKRGVKVSIDQKRCLLPWGEPDTSIGLYCLHSHTAEDAHNTKE